MKRVIIKIFILILILYSLLCSIFFFLQESFIFQPTKLDREYKFEFNENFEEVNIPTNDGIILNGLLFKTDHQTKGLIFYLHGNAGALDSWGSIAPLYTDLGYDIFLLDYRGFGKSQGTIKNQDQLVNDIQTAYIQMKKIYSEKDIIIIGYSIGTGPAAMIAAANSPKELILQAPYYSLKDIIHKICPILPNFIIKYKLETYKYISDCKVPVIIFHGDKDELINYNNSKKLERLFKEGDQLITLKNEKHNTIIDSKAYQTEIGSILENN